MKSMASDGTATNEPKQTNFNDFTNLNLFLLHYKFIQEQLRNSAWMFGTSSSISPQRFRVWLLCSSELFLW